MRKTENRKSITLENGTRIILEKNESIRSCLLGIFVLSGSRFEEPETAGISHFMEHMLFKGTPTRSARRIAEEMDEIGGVLNAYTTAQYTCFYAKTLREYAPRAFDVICDMVCNPRLDSEDIETEKGVVKEEIAGSEDSPEELCSALLYRNVFPDHMLGSSILGTRETVENFNREMLLAHRRRFYVPGRTVISVCGNFDEEAILAMGRQYFSRAAAAGEPISFLNPVYHRSISAVKKEAEQNQLILCFPGIPYESKQYFALDLMETILGTADSSMLFQRIREELGLVYNVGCANECFVGSGLFTVYMSLSSKTEKQAIREAVQIMAGFCRAVTEKDLSRAKARNISETIMSMESVYTRACHNGRSELLINRIESEEETERLIRGVTLADVKAVAKQVFDFDKLSLSAVGKTHSAEWYKKQIRECREEFGI